MSEGPLVLVADDEPLVLEVAVAFLERAGFRVLTARDGVEALALHARLGAELAAVIVDWSMPGVDGEAVVRELRRRDARLPLLVATGFGAALKLPGDVPGPALVVLPKPFRGSLLGETVRQVIAGTSG
jgi:CheY-like chemotaxis protein